MQRGPRCAVPGRRMKYIVVPEYEKKLWRKYGWQGRGEKKMREKRKSKEMLTTDKEKEKEIKNIVDEDENQTKINK